MPNPTDIVKINLNQNLWTLIVGLASLGVSEYLKLSALFWFSVIIAGVTTLSICVTTFAYTKAYWKKKV